MYLYQRYLNNITLENIKKAIKKFSLLSGLKEMYEEDEELKDSALEKLDEMYPKTADYKYTTYSPVTIHGKIHKLLKDIKENNNEYSLYEYVQTLYIIILYFFQKNQEKVDSIPIRELHYEEYIKNFPKIKNVEMIESEMNTEKVDSYNNMLKYFRTPKNKNIYENMIRDIYVAYRSQGNENEVKCLNLICELRKLDYDLIYNKMRERYISEGMFRGKEYGIEKGIPELIITHYAFFRRKSVRKSRRKSVRKSRRKSVRKSRRKSVRKSRRKSVGKSVGKSVRKSR